MTFQTTTTIIAMRATPPTAHPTIIPIGTSLVSVVGVVGVTDGSSSLVSTGPFSETTSKAAEVTVKPRLLILL